MSKRLVRGVILGLPILPWFGRPAGANAQGSPGCCPLPETETTAEQGADPLITSATDFLQQVSPWSDGVPIDEYSAGSGSDTCYFDGSEIPPFTSVTGGSWDELDDGFWGMDIVGWSEDAVTYYREEDPSRNGLPCGATLWQALEIECSMFDWETYTPSYGNKLTATIDSTTVTNCRYDISNSSCDTH